MNKSPSVNILCLCKHLRVCALPFAALWYSTWLNYNLTTLLLIGIYVATIFLLYNVAGKILEQHRECLTTALSFSRS